MSAERDWERTLREDQYDLPAQTWQRMENDMRGWLAAQARQSKIAPEPSRPWWAAWLRPARWGAALAGLAVAAVLVQYRTLAPSDLQWQAGQSREFSGGKLQSWPAARCELQGLDARLTLARVDDQTVQVRLDQGEATFQVQPRRAGETFQVELAKDCQVQVVGTVFTVGKDSLKAWVAVQEGRVRLQTATEGQFVDQGGRAQCPEPKMEKERIATGADPSVGAKDSVPAVTVVPPIAATEIKVPSCNEPGPCVATLSAFVRQHPDHPAVSEVALRWGRLATRGGDPRDALVGYSHVKSPVLHPLAKLESMQLRAREFGEQAVVADSLDHWMSALKTSDPIWKPVAQFRVELYKRLGDDSGARRLQERISGSATAESRGR